MGEVSEMIINGILCQQCGEYVGNPVGHSRICKHCQQSAKPTKQPKSNKQPKAEKK